MENKAIEQPVKSNHYVNSNERQNTSNPDMQDEELVKGYSSNTREREEEVSNSPTQQKKTVALLAETLDVTSATGQTYRIYPTLSQEQAQQIETGTGVVLKLKEGKISGFLGGGAFGRVYVGESLTANQEPTGQFCAVKIIQGNPTKVAESAHEAVIQKHLTENQAPETSQLMPLIDVAEERESGALKRLYYVLPLAALGNVDALRKQLNTIENQELRRLVS